MTDTTTSTLTHAAGHAGSEALSTSILQLVSDSMAELAGFELVRICLARPQGLVNAVVTGNEQDIAEQLGMLTPMDVLIDAEQHAHDFGSFRFLEIDRPGDPQWATGDLLYAPLYDDQGGLSGVVALDRPIDGMRPRADKQNVLSQHAEAASRAVRTVLERERLAEEVRLTELAREMVRTASRHATLEEAFDESAQALIDVFGLDRVWLGEFFRDGTLHGYLRGRTGREAEPDLLTQTFAFEAGTRLWAAQRVGVLGEELRSETTEDEDRIAHTLEFLRAEGLGPMLYAPLGAGSECLGLLVLWRSADAPPWTASEQQAARDMGRDLGLVVHHSRAVQREQELAAQLRGLDVARSQLLATVAHELRNPLSSIVGYLDLLETASLDSAETVRAVAAIDRSAVRMRRIVSDLNTFSEAGDQSPGSAQAVIDLRDVARDVVDLVDAAAARRGLTVTVRTPEVPTLVYGDASQLDQALVNLVSNAVKYTDPGGRVNVVVRPADDFVEIAVHDDGIGILPDDLPHLFNEFFRSTNPEALSRPGTGLGLVIAHRIIERHSGTISVDSTPGRGSTFVVRLPRAAVR